MRVEIVVRNRRRYHVINYLVQMGGKVTELLEVEGDGWTAYIEALEPVQVGLVEVPRDRLVIEGDERAVERVRSFMERNVRRVRK